MKDHQHQQLVTGKCAGEAFDPTNLVMTIIKGMRDTKDLEGKFDNANRIHAVLESNCTATSTKVKKLGGEHVQLEWDDRNFMPVYKDEYTNEMLSTHLIRAAIIEDQ